jgi:plastocyanin
VRLPAVLLAAALPLAVAACGSGSSSGGSSDTTAGSCPKGAVVVHMRDIRFDPEDATAKVGQKVCWTNDDDVQHDAVDEDGHAFHSALFGQGKTFTWKADKAGTVKYVCTVHPGMDGEIDVTS